MLRGRRAAQPRLAGERELLRALGIVRGARHGRQRDRHRRQRLQRVGANFAVPPGCNAPPGPPTVTLAVNGRDRHRSRPDERRLHHQPRRGQRRERRGQLHGRRHRAHAASTTSTLPATATIPAGALSVDVPVVPIDDSALESNETVILTLRSGSGYVLGSPSTGTVTIVSDDVAPDFTVTALTRSRHGRRRADARRHRHDPQPGHRPVRLFRRRPSICRSNTLLDASDPLLGTRDVPALVARHERHRHDDVDRSRQRLARAATTSSPRPTGPALVSESIETNNTRARARPHRARPGDHGAHGAGHGRRRARRSPSPRRRRTRAAAAPTARRRGSICRPTLARCGRLRRSRHDSVGPLGRGRSRPATTTVTIPATAPSGIVLPHRRRR